MSLPIFVSRNGEVIPAADAQVSVFNPALTGAYGIYESFQVVNGVIFALTPHLERMAHSAKMLELPLPADLTAFRHWAVDVVAANQVCDCTLRLFVLGPENGGGSLAFIWPEDARNYPASFYTHGADAITYEGQRTLPTAKTLNTLVSFLAQRQARKAKVHEALLHHDGCLTEGSNSNLFAVIDDEVLTAPSEQVLSGVARDTVMRLAAQNGIALRQTIMPVLDLIRWQECFITSTSRHVMPITRIDGRPVGNGEVGPITHRLMELFETYFAQATFK